MTRAVIPPPAVSPPAPAPALDDVLRSLVRRGHMDAEVYVKRGRSRRLAIGGSRETSTVSQEKGWAVRAGNRRSSFFLAGTGEPPVDGPWPGATGRTLRLPEPEPVAPWNEPSDFDAPLIGEREGLKLLESLGRELASELPKARLLHAALEDGSSEGELGSTRGIRSRSRHRIATLYLEAVGPGVPPVSASLYVAAREARRFHPSALARRLADRLAVAAAGAPPERDSGEFLLAPPVAVRLLAGLLPLFLGPDAIARIADFRDRRGRIGGDRLTVIDDGRYPGGPLESPIDGEGLSTREVVLVDAGLFRQPLLAWHQAGAASTLQGLHSGCVRRAGWRDLPLPGPTHLFVRPEPRTSVASLLSSVSRGYYLIDAEGAGRFDLEADRFRLPVCGFAVADGRASAPVAHAWLTGSVGALLKGIVGVGRDLSFHPLAGMLGSPTLLVTGVELRASPV